MPRRPVCSVWLLSIRTLKDANLHRRQRATHSQFQRLDVRPDGWHESLQWNSLGGAGDCWRNQPSPPRPRAHRNDTTCSVVLHGDQSGHAISVTGTVTPEPTRGCADGHVRVRRVLSISPTCRARFQRPALSRGPLLRRVARSIAVGLDRFGRNRRRGCGQHAASAARQRCPGRVQAASQGDVPSRPQFEGRLAPESPAPGATARTTMSTRRCGRANAAETPKATWETPGDGRSPVGR